MKILQITGFYPPSLGGIQLFVQSLCKSLVEIGHHVDVLTINTENVVQDEITPQGIKILRCKLDFNYHRGLFSQEFFHRMLASKGHDIYHVHIPFPYGHEAAVLSSKLNNIPLVATHHGQSLHGNIIYTAIAGSYSIFSRAISFRFLDRIVFLTNSYAQSIWLPDGLHNKIRIVPTGADLDTFLPARNGYQIRQKFGIPNSSPLLIFVGHLGKTNRYKGIDYLIRAFKKVLKEVEEVKLLIIGGGDWLPELKSLSGKLELNNAIIFTGPIENHHLPDYYAAADAFVLPSIRGPENSPVVLFEAMASGLPVIATDLPGVNEIVRPEETGLLVEPRNIPELKTALVRVLSDPDFQSSAGKKARVLAESYSWHQCAHDMENIYGELLDE
jgi:glycosyltransferase involved in cell wall biosynthesis